MHRVTSIGATPGGFVDTNGITAIGNPTITGLASTGAVNPGDYVLTDKGFPDIGRIRVVSKTPTTLTLATNATSAETGVTVTSQANMYTDGVAGVVSRTIAGAKHLDSIQEELCNLVVAAGGSLSEVLNNSLKDLLIRINGGQAMTGDLELPSYQLTKFVAGAGVTATKNIQTRSGHYAHATLAVNSEVKLFNYGTDLDEKLIALALIAKYTVNASERLASFRIITKTGEDAVGPNNAKRFIIPEDMAFNFDSASVSPLGGLYLNQSSSNPTTIFDGVGARNERIMLILDHDSVYLRNSHNTFPITAIEIYLQSFNLLI